MMAMKTWGLRWAAVLVLAAAPPGCARARSDPQPADPYAISAEQFFDRDAVDQSLLPGEIDTDLLAAAVFHQTNLARRDHGLAPLHHDPRLDRAADMQARSMRKHHYVGHENTFDQDLRWPMARVLATGYVPRAVSENVAQVFRARYDPPQLYYRVRGPAGTVFSFTPDGEEPIPPHTYASFARFVVQAWMESPEHRENILRPQSRELGTAVRFRDLDDDLDKAYAVQVFAQPMQP